MPYVSAVGTNGEEGFRHHISEELKKTTPGRALENLFYLQYDLPPEASFHATTEEAKRPDELYMRKLLPELTRLKLQPRHVVANDEAYYAVMKGVIALYTGSRKADADGGLLFGTTANPAVCTGFETTK